MRPCLNPVLPGFHPDPSVCRVGEWFYLATSSFHFFPGLPLHRSRNLVDWELAGYAISSDRQLDLRGTPPSRGLFAPTLRHHGARFYLTCTEVDRLGNFLVSAPSIEGPWSDPLPLALGGIDPSLCFDEPGKAYLCATGREGGRACIVLAAIDPESGDILEGPRPISCGTGGRWPEGPRLFRRGPFWYLLLSEGGTEYGHYSTVFRATSPWGPWEASPHGSILGHRDYPEEAVQCLGHPDLVDDPKGRSWALCLGVRPLGPLLHNLGRETFLAPVTWGQDGWPVIGQGGRVDLRLEPPDLPGVAGASSGFEEDFAQDGLDPRWVSLRSWPGDSVRIEAGQGLVLEGGPWGLSDPCASPVFLGRPQTALECRFEADLDFQPTNEASEAGIAALYDEDYHYEAFVTLRGGARVLVLRRRIHDLEREGPVLPLPARGPVRLTLQASRESYGFSCASLSGPPGAREAGPVQALGSGLAAGLCTEGTWRMSFTGVHLGLYCKEGRALFRRASCVDAWE